MKKRYAILLLVLLALIGGAAYYRQTQTNVLPEGYVLIERYRTNSNVFSCAARAETESNCELYASNLSGDDRRPLGITLEYGSWEPGQKGLLLSPDKKYLLIVLERQSVLLDTATLERRVIAEASQGTVFGIYSSFPSFLPEARWLSNDKVEVSIFPANTYEPVDESPPPTPKEIKVVSLD